jgi:CubicO group peptidase (beta-lactamase class C family)
LIASQPLEFAPGAKYRYSNSGYLLLGLIVEAVSGEHLADFLSRRIFAPLGMDAMGVTGRIDWPVARAANGYRIVDGVPVQAPAVSRSLNSTGDGSVYSTLSDLIKWDAALYGDHPLSSASRAAMWSSARLNDGTSIAYGFGWGVANIPGHRVIEHGGQWQGFSAHIVRYLDDSITVVVLMNATGLGNAAGLIANRVARYYLPSLHSDAWPRTATIVVDTATLASYTGEFRFGNSTIRIWREDRQLFVSGTGRGTARLIPISPTEFTIAADRVRFRFRAQRGRKPDLYVRDLREQLATRLR